MILNEKTVLPLFNGDRNSKNVSIKAMNNIIEPFPNIGEVKFDDSFDWKYRPDKSTDTFQLYLQNLRVVSALLDHYRNTKDINLVLKAKEITESWFDYVETDEPTNMTWYDHTTANRTQAIIELMYTLQTLKIEFDGERYGKIIEKHAEVLTDDSIHLNNNHALMMDRSLMMLGIILENEYYLLKGLDRAKTVFWLSFSMKGVHLENSPAYHFMVFRIYKEIENYLNINNSSLGEEVLRMFSLIDEYQSYIVKPNNIIPPIGDSGRIPLKSKKDYNWSSFSDPAAGINIIKNEESKLYLAYICGYSSHVHKHADDLSMIINYKDKDFFEDAGMFGYGRSKNRTHVKSYKGHSIFSTGDIYKKDRNNKINRLVYTDQFIDSPLYSIVSGYNKAIKNSKLRRTLYYLPEVNILIGHDYGTSKESKSWIQNFNLSEEVEIEKKNENYKLTNGDTSIYLSFYDQDNSTIVKGNKEDFTAINSNKPHTVIETNQVVNIIKGKTEFDGFFIVSFDNEKDVTIKRNKNDVTVLINDEEYDIKLPYLKI